MKKVTKLLHFMFEQHTFLRDTPSGLSRVLTPNDVSGKTWRKLTECAEYVRDLLSTYKAVKVCRWTLRDKGSAYLEILPCPLGVVEVLTNDGIVRYAAMMFYQENHALLSVRKLTAGDITTVTGLNPDAGAADLINLVWRLCQPKLSELTITIDRRSQIDTALKVMGAKALLVTPELVAKNIQQLPPIGIFVLLHCTEAALTPLLPSEARGLYYPTVVLSDAADTADKQCAELRHLLAEWNFVRRCDNPSGLIAEVALQSEADIKLLQSIKGLPVLCRCNLDPQQKKLTTLMQTAQTDLVEASRSSAVLQTVPLLIGTSLPEHHVALTMEWSTFEYVNRTAVHYLAHALSEKLSRPEAAAAELEQSLLSMRLGEYDYPAAHFLAAAQAVDYILFGETDWHGILLERAQQLIDVIYASEENRIHRYADAAALLEHHEQLDAFIADSADRMTKQHLGFWYAVDGKPARLAFGLEDFADLIEKLGLARTDSLPFRRYLLERGFLDAVSEKARGRDKTKSSTHVLLRPEKCGYEVRKPQNGG